MVLVVVVGVVVTVVVVVGVVETVVVVVGELVCDVVGVVVCVDVGVVMLQLANVPSMNEFIAVASFGTVPALQTTFMKPPTWHTNDSSKSATSVRW